MKIFISPIGKTTDHVKGWLAEESRGVQILWLIHSKKGKTDFPKIAKKLKTDLKSAYPRLKIKLKTIDSALEIDSTMDAIAEIIHKEMDDGNALLKSEFTLNITGGTNVMAAATMISATWYGTKAHYVLEPQPEDPEDKQYVLDLPVKVLNTAKTKDIQLTILRIISESNYFIENTPKGISQEDIEIAKGSTTRKELLEKINNFTFSIKNKDRYNQQQQSIHETVNFLHYNGKGKPWQVQNLIFDSSHIYQNEFRKLNLGFYHIVFDLKTKVIISFLQNIFSLRILKLEKPFQYIYLSIKAIFKRY